MVQATVETGNEAACLRCGEKIEKGDLCESCDHEITAPYCEQHQLPIGSSGLCEECEFEAYAGWCGEHGVILDANGSCAECDEILSIRPVDAVEAPLVVLAPPADMDFVRLYANYADVLEVPKMMHEAVGIQLVASLLNRNGVVIPLGGGVTYTLDVWTALLSASGAGRSTLVKLPGRVIKRAEIQDLTRNIQWGSPQAFYQQLSECPNGLYIWGEFSEKMKTLNGAQFGAVGAKEWLTDRYDDLSVPASWVYRKTGKETDTPPIVFQFAPRLNILATSSEEWFFKNLAVEDSAGGFVPRWLLIRVTGPGRDVAIPPDLDERALGPLGFGLREIAKLNGAADLSRVLNCYKEWYSPTKRRFENQPNRSLATAFFNRHRGHILKLAVIYEASHSLSLKVSEESWQRAVHTADSIEKTIFALLSTGMSGEGYAVEQMAERVRLAGAGGLALSEFTRAFQGDNRMVREQRMKTLVTGETVFLFQRKTGGRTALTLVHHSFAPEYQTQHPEERRWGFSL